MRRIYRSLLMLSAVAVLARGGGRDGNGATLATKQTLRFSMQNDIQTLDPAHASSSPDIVFISEMFSGLYKFDQKLNVVPDLAVGMPDMSLDGKTYTFKLRRDGRFWNGDPLTARDVLYSWNRAAYLNDAYAAVFDPIVGASEVLTNRARTMSGLTARDDYTIVARLAGPAGYWLTELALWTANLVDQKEIGDYADPNNQRNDSWWTQAETAVGSGPFRLRQRTPKVSLDFQPVSGWFGGSTGTLTGVHVDVGVDPGSAVKKFETGGYDLVGVGDSSAVGPDDVLRYRADPNKSSLITTYPSASSTWLGFNFADGPFQGREQGRNGRLAFSLAIDRRQLVDVGCVQGATCIPATGGFKG